MLYVPVGLRGPVVELLRLFPHLYPGLRELGAAIVRHDRGVALPAKLERQVYRSENTDAQTIGRA